MAHKDRYAVSCLPSLPYDLSADTACRTEYKNSHVPFLADQLPAWRTELSLVASFDYMSHKKSRFSEAL